MGTPRRKSILDNLLTTLEGITVVDGYKTNVVRVERVVKDWESVASEKPWVGFKVGRDAGEYLPFDTLKFRMPVEIIGHVAGSTDEERSSRLNNLLDDVIAALHVDVTRGSYAISTTVVSLETDEGDPDTMDSRGGSASFVMLVEVLYERTIERS